MIMRLMRLSKYSLFMRMISMDCGVVISCNDQQQDSEDKMQAKSYGMMRLLSQPHRQQGGVQALAEACAIARNVST